MLLNDFFKIINLETYSKESEGETASASIKLNKEHPIYAGHFPGNPVVPGVCLVEIIKELAEEIYKKDLFLAKADNIKFLNVVNPLENDILNIEMTLKKSDTLKLKASISFDGKIFLKFSGTLT